MFYEPRLDNHGLPHRPLKAIVTPRPIGWISTLAPDGTANLAPYSFFNLLSEEPDIVGFSSSGAKHSMRNAEASGEFVCNLATLPLLEQVNLTSKPIPASASEFDLAGLEQAPSRLVKAPRVAAAPCALECRYIETIRLKGADGREAGTFLVLGEVIGVHIDERFIEDGLLKAERMQPIARGGYFDYSWVDRVKSLPRPAGGE
ncbi:flavin reductase family protein [Ancylobacter sp. 6x-1]|uniref:Flavin reductase family protein n=1 Tax=Ancylobacter crimeensis TaxID=2579147 RepID=A0ABT0DF60_9HYPH|nr:flavin reductase family protein [Ancylobacter crimeensis]MCK0198588.1 flavin reductase family protein [Ancylobacter crimeensis]